jgi:hypothetical protein
MKILDVLEGPIHSSNYPDYDEVDDGFGFPFGQCWILVVKAQREDGSVGVEELQFAEREAAIDLIDHFTAQISWILWEDTV